MSSVRCNQRRAGRAFGFSNPPDQIADVSEARAGVEAGQVRTDNEWPWGSKSGAKVGEGLRQSRSAAQSPARRSTVLACGCGCLTGGMWWQATLISLGVLVVVWLAFLAYLAIARPDTGTLAQV